MTSRKKILPFHQQIKDELLLLAANIKTAQEAKDESESGLDIRIEDRCNKIDQEIEDLKEKINDLYDKKTNAETNMRTTLESDYNYLETMYIHAHLLLRTALAFTIPFTTDQIQEFDRLGLHWAR